jgi:hypothetical protein
MLKSLLSQTFVVFLATAAAAQNPHLVVYQGDKGPGHGKHIVFLAGDHEYRSEESLPALARILAKHYGFRCSVFFTTDPDTGFIEPGSSNLVGLEALKTADLLVIFLRFQDFPDAEMQHIADYLARGGPVVGFRTATHAFQIKRPGAKFLKYHWQTGDAYPGGFGRQILGETWVSHYGTNHKMSSRRKGHLGPVGRVYGTSDRGKRGAGQGADSRRHDARLASRRRQGADACGVVSHLYERVGKDRAGLHDNARRVGGSPERRIQTHERERLSMGGRAGHAHRRIERHQVRRPVSSIHVRIRRLRQGREAGGHGRMGHANPEVANRAHARARRPENSRE